MKKLCSVSVVLILLMSLCGCKLPEFNLRDLSVIKHFQCDLSVKAGSHAYYCHFIRNENSAELSVIEPERIEGLTLACSNDLYSASFKGITISLDDSRHQKIKSFASGFMETLEEIFNTESFQPVYENGMILYDGDGKLGEYTVAFDMEGRLLSMELPGLDTVITVENFEL